MNENDQFRVAVADRFNIDLVRVHTLLDSAEMVPSIELLERGGSDARSDIRRGAVLLLHATFETLLRSLAAFFLPLAAPENLSKIPLYNLPRNAEKFTLEDLAEHRGLSVDRLISLSVVAHLDQKSYNDVGELKRLLERIGYSRGLIGEIVDAHLADLQAMIKRRHLIAHRADRSIGPEGVERVDPLDRETVDNWIDAVLEFGRDLITRLPDMMPPEGDRP